MLHISLPLPRRAHVIVICCRATVGFTLISLLARIVGRIDVVDASRPDELNLDDRLLVSRPHKMRVFCGLREERTALGHPALVVEFFTHAKADAAADQGDGLGIGMGVWRDNVVGRELDALDDNLAGFRRVAQQYRDLATLWNGRV